MTAYSRAISLDDVAFNLGLETGTHRGVDGKLLGVLTFRFYDVDNEKIAEHHLVFCPHTARDLASGVTGVLLELIDELEARTAETN